MSAENGSPLSQGWVLVVDDEDDIRDSLREAVEMAGCSAVLAANGVDALEAIEGLAGRLPCLILLDLSMPVMGGAELITHLKKDPLLATIPLIISTSAPDRAPAGIPVLPKPIDIAALWEWMRRTCDCAASPPSRRLRGA